MIHQPAVLRYHRRGVELDAPPSLPVLSDDSLAISIEPVLLAPDNSLDERIRASHFFFI